MKTKVADVLSMKKPGRALSFIRTYSSLTEVLTDHALASLGDAYVNLIYSLALSNKRGRPSGTKVKGSLLAEGLRRAGLRPYVPSSVSNHVLADSAEALIVYAWLHGCVAMNEAVAILEKSDDLAEGFSELLKTIMNRIKLS